MKRFLSVLAASALVVSLAAVAAAQDKDKDAKDKDKKAPPAKEKSDKEAPPKEKEKSDKDLSAVKTTPAGSDYFPLKAGNVWYYKIGENHYSLKLTKFEKVGDINCARIEMIQDEKVYSVEHIAASPEGMVRVAFDDKKAEPPLLFLKLPYKKGETWKVDSTVGKTDKAPGDRVKGTFKEGEAPRVKVPAGEYETITATSDDLNANGTGLKFTSYFAKDVGMVKQEISIAGENVVVELERFEPAK